jgi:hypothetical protein
MDARLAPQPDPGGRIIHDVQAECDVRFDERRYTGFGRASAMAAGQEYSFVDERPGNDRQDAGWNTRVVGLDPDHQGAGSGEQIINVYAPWVVATYRNAPGRDRHADEAQSGFLEARNEHTCILSLAILMGSEASPVGEIHSTCAPAIPISLLYASHRSSRGGLYGVLRQQKGPGYGPGLYLRTVSPQDKPEQEAAERLESAVRAELDRLLASELFLRSPRLSAFLRFVTERTLAGQGNLLKEHVLGAELYGKGEQFDGAVDPIVRVDARRLRDKLREYYAECPRGQATISLPKGSYVPVFTVNGIHAPPYRSVPKDMRLSAKRQLGSGLPP